MSLCKQCGANLEDDATFCTSCGAPVSTSDNQLGNSASSQGALNNIDQSSFTGVFNQIDTDKVKEKVGNVASAISSYSEKTATAITNGVQSYQESKAAIQNPEILQMRGLVLSEGEVIVRSYLCAQVINPKATGYLTVTNKRVCFEGFGSSQTTKIFQETWLSGISGVNTFIGWDISIMKIIIGVIILMMTPIALSSDSFSGFMVFILAVCLIISAFQKCFKLSLTSSGAAGTGISLGSSPTSLIGNGALMALSSRPTPETDRMIRELGALILDLQTRGDLAIKYWQ